MLSNKIPHHRPAYHQPLGYPGFGRIWHIQTERTSSGKRLNIQRAAPSSLALAALKTGLKCSFVSQLILRILFFFFFFLNMI
jgi:hypothetical protein